MPQPHRPTSQPRNLLLCIILLALIPFATQAQSLLSDNQSSHLTNGTLQATSNPFVSTASSVDFLPVEQAYQLIPNVFGDQIQLQWQIADGYYLYEHNLSISLNNESLPLTLPPGQIRYDDYFEKELSVYYQQLQLDLPIKTASNQFTLKVNSQGCADAGLCYPPQTQFIDVNLEAQTATLQAAANRATPAPTASPTPSETPANNDTSGMTLISAWLLAMLGGIILNLMPCVFPVLSLKALGLANASQERQHLHGWSYTAGAVATFVGIASLLFIARRAGEAAGWGFQLQSPVVVALLAYLFFIMGLSLSGIIHLQSRWTDLGDDLTRGHTLKASFFTGALATVVASPCTAPFMGAALGWALVQPTGIGLSVFAALGFGMALPFLLLSYLPQLSRALPKPGPWMDTLKQGLAFPLYLTSVWLLWVLGRQHGSDSVALLITGMTLIGFAAWLVHTNSHQPAHLLLRRSLAAISLAIAVTPLISISRPAVTESVWQPYSPTTLQQLLAQGEPVFVNLTADWCITCLANEKIALDTDASHATFERLGIHRLKGDWTNYNPAITDLLSQFNRSGVPLYLFYANGLNSPAQVLPQLLTESLVIETLESINHQDARKIADNHNK